ncbi:MAG: CehA/McbA family metallohydrolase [Candidatus Hydrogenedentes bacterium]|nr:CehA/McbA family metallohydrolase [Candidatus Hydrogenedentota bacterium]
MRNIILLLTCLTLVACAGKGGVRHRDVGTTQQESVSQQKKEEAELEKQAALAKRAALPRGILDVDITNVVGDRLPTRVDLLCFDDSTAASLDVPEGVLESPQPIGSYRAYVHVYDAGVPVLVAVEDLIIREARPTYLLVNLLEGAGGAMSLRNFDADGDLALDRVEIEMGTDPYNAAGIPGVAELFHDTRVLNEDTQWYCGELHAYSKHGVGTETVGELVKRAEKANLDFLAITDRNTLAAIHDSDFHSEQLILLPAMEWGTDEMGVALVYGPRTQPDIPGNMRSAQAECIRVQAQGGAWIIAHPTFPTKPWQWGLSFVNGVETWFRDWRGVPSMVLKQLDEPARERSEGKLIHSIAAAAAAESHGAMSSNAQSSLFYDYELVRGLLAGAVGGSGSGSKNVPLGQPVTYIHARELSVEGLLEGLRLGRTYISCSTDGPKLYFAADVLSDKKMDVGIGGIIPLNVEVSFEVVVHDAVGKKLQVIENGRPIRTIPINAKETAIRFKRFPTSEAAYRVRVIGAADPKARGFGPLEVYAMSSPIYARDITQELLMRNPDFDPSKSWVRLQSGSITDFGYDLPEQTSPSQVQGW